VFFLHEFIVGREVFIPGHRLLSMAAIAGAEWLTPYKDEVLYRSSLFSFYCDPVSGPLLGMAARALEYVIERTPEKGIAQTTYQPQSSSIGFQASVGNASMLIETAHLQAYSAAGIIDDAARDGRALSAVEQARLRMSPAHAAESLVKSVDLLMYAHGSSSFMERTLCSASGGILVWPLAMRVSYPRSGQRSTVEPYRE
jgi:3-hydroxy-9,10-secoandrosta-1,3,5(10)-triene-9,17-dione monooxygenase